MISSLRLRYWVRVMGLEVPDQMRLIVHCDEGWKTRLEEGESVSTWAWLLRLPADCGSSKSCVCASAFDHQENPLVSNFHRLPTSKNTPNQRASRSKKKIHPHNPQNSIKRNMYQNIISHLFLQETSPKEQGRRGMKVQIKSPPQCMCCR